MLEFQAQMVDDVTRQAANIAQLGHDIAPEMSVDEAGEKPDTPGRHQNPGEEEMDHSPGREVVVGRDRRPGREGLEIGLGVSPALAQEAGGLESCPKPA